MELRANAYKALEDLLTTKASIDAHRQRAIWELGIELHWNESKAAKCIKEAKAVCSQVTLDAKTNCSQVILEPRPLAQQQSMKPRQPEALSSKRPTLPVPKPSERLRPGGPLWLSHSKGSMVTSCRTWRNKSSERRAEVELTSSLPVRSPCTPGHQGLKALWLLPTTSYWDNHLHCLHSPCYRGLPLWMNSWLPLLLLHQCPSSLLGPKDGTLQQIL